MQTFKKFYNVNKKCGTFVFDLDGTLVNTDAKIIVKDPQGRVVKELTPYEYTTYKKAPTEILDFSQFNDPNVLKNTYTLIPKNFKKLKEISDNPNCQMYILTARESSVKNIISNILSSNGIDVSRVNILCIGDEALKTDEPIPNIKKKKLQEIRNKHRNTEITFYDDDEKNIDLASQIKGIRAILV